MNQPATLPAISPNLLFRYTIPCRETKLKWSPQGAKLSEAYRLPAMGQFENQIPFAEVKAAWSQAGLFFNLKVIGKKQSVWCRPTQLAESDGLRLWIDTRNTQTIHRASRFCHWFLFLPAGAGGKQDRPIGTMLKINRAKEDPKSFSMFRPHVLSQIKGQNYALHCFIPAQALTGWDTSEHRKIGFSYAVSDRELGYQTLASGPELPIAEDPSLWHTLELVSGKSKSK